MVLSSKVFGQTHTVKTIVYNTLVLNSNKLLMKNAHFGIRATIIKGDEKGQVIYAETLKGQTNNKGNLTIDIGVGYVVAGKYSNFDITGGPYVIKLELDPHGGTNYTINITRPFVNSAKNVQSTFRFSVGSKVIVKRYIGELYGGGIIFHLTKDSLGNEHGLIASLHDVSTNAKWGLGGIDFYGFKNASEGRDNYKAMLNNGAEPGTAARVVEKYQHDGFKDWYLPALKELLLMYQVKDIIDKVLDTDKNEKTKGLERKHYWSSTGYSASTSWFFSFYNGGATNYGKHYVFNVRAVRAF
jgi:hypothetical protein